MLANMRALWQKPDNEPTRNSALVAELCDGPWNILYVPVRHVE